MSNMIGRDLLRISDLSKEELLGLIRFSKRLKIDAVRSEDLRGKSLVMLFAKTSTRTRVSFEVAMTQLGGHAINLNWNETNFVKGNIRDESKNLGKYCDVLMTRLFKHEDTVTIAEACEKPVINGMDDLHHPCQALADLLTVYEAKGRLEGVKIGWVGDGTNVCNSLMQGADLVGASMKVATPVGYEPKIKTAATIIHDPIEAARDADVLVTDSWVSLGLESETEKRLKVFALYQLNSNLLSYARKDCIVLHCLPAQRGKEITSEVLDSPQSWVFQEAENRMHTEKALLLELIGYVK